MGCGVFQKLRLISKIADHAFEMMMNSRVASVKQIVISAYSAIFAKLDDQHRNTNMNDKDHLVGQLTTHFYTSTSPLIQDMQYITKAAILFQFIDEAKQTNNNTKKKGHFTFSESDNIFSGHQV